MIPSITTHHDVVRMERAAALARAEKTRVTRDQEDTHIAHIETKAGRQVGLDSLRLLHGLVRERLATSGNATRVASAHR